MLADFDASNDTVAGIEKELRYINGIITQKGREILGDFAITPPQFYALQWLFDEGDMTIGDLSSKMYLACSTTTDLVDRMEKNKLVERIKDSKDRRIVRIHLLSEGTRIINEVIEKRRLYVRQLVNNFSEEEVLSLKNILEKMHLEMKLE